jgi:hypothetical protein
MCNYRHHPKRDQTNKKSARPLCPLTSLRSPDQRQEPYFGYFLERDLFHIDPAKASAKAGLKLVQYDLLARGIPALSFAAAVHPLERLKNLTNPSLSRNFDMEGRNEGVWPCFVCYLVNLIGEKRRGRGQGAKNADRLSAKIPPSI